jgi:hypothetical protein
MDQALRDTLNQIFGSRIVLVLTQLAVGMGLLYAIDKFFKFVEEKLTDDTKLEIAVWLLGVKVGQKLEPWPETFAKLFDRVFGREKVSWRFVFRASLAAVATMLLPLGVTLAISTRLFIWPFLSTLALYIAYSDLSMLKSRFVLQRIARTSNLWMVLSLLILDMAVRCNKAVLLNHSPFQVHCINALNKSGKICFGMDQGMGGAMLHR